MYFVKRFSKSWAGNNHSGSEIYFVAPKKVNQSVEKQGFLHNFSKGVFEVV